MIGYPRAKIQRVGQILCEKGAITQESLRLALEEQKITYKPIGVILVARGFTTEETVARAIAEQVEIPFIDAPVKFVKGDALKLIPESLARRLAAMPLEIQEDGELLVAMADFLDIIAIEDLGYASQRRISPVISTKEAITTAIDACYGTVDAIADLIEGIELDQVEVVGREALDLEKILDTDIDPPVVKLVNLMILEAIRQRATDVHIEPTAKLMRVRYRVDGILREVMSPPKKMHAAVSSRVKVMAALNIAERRMPQDGRALIKTRDGYEVDMRVNIAPTIYGEKIEMRLLKQDLTNLEIARLGMAPDTIQQFLELIHRPNGMILCVGPTGSGKTTTLYAALKQLNASTQHILTIEDPVEYRLENINQMQVNTKAGFTFSEGLRSILRQDPNIILVGEIRDRETAEIATEAALTGHLIFSTLHSTDVAHTVARLTTLGIDPFLAATSITGIISTRLVRCLCANCRLPYQPEEKLAKQLGSAFNGTLYRAGGCDECRQTGYRGRTSIYELIPIDRHLKEVIQSKASVTDMQSALGKMNLRTLWADGVEKVLAGTIPFEEIMRVTRNYLTEPPAGKAP